MVAKGGSVQVFARRGATFVVLNGFRYSSDVDPIQIEKIFSKHVTEGGNHFRKNRQASEAGRRVLN